jgi:hypothetical protein
MSLTNLLLLIGTVALLLTLTSVLLLKSPRNWGLKFLQFFAGTLFVISGYVKAVDPLGTAFKMEQYFAEFETAFSGTWMSFLSPLFPALASQSVWFSIGMIVLELALGFMLLLGIWKRFTVWAFFLVILFFTVLTGFTYLTGYVPSGQSFFSFGSWGPFDKNNMKVTDCGCFGDFIKLEPKTSFLKDVFLLVPALIFLFMSRSFQSFFHFPVRRTLTLSLIGLSLLFCVRNVWWDEPISDFRPFQVGIDLRGQKAAEEDALANVSMTMVIKNKASGEIVQMPQDQYMKEFKNYPKEDWEYLDPIKGEPAIPITKINDFEVSDPEDGDMTYAILDHEGYQLLVISHTLKESGYTESALVRQDTLWAMDTLEVQGELEVVRRIEHINQETVLSRDYQWSASFLRSFTEQVVPLLDEAEQAGITNVMITRYSDPEKMLDFSRDAGFRWDIYQADDILLKTIIRSNPGVVLLHDGKILAKWHIRQLPAFQDIKRDYIR